jgi:HemY protein
MIRVLFFFIGVTIVALGAAWLADRPGEVNVLWNGYQIHTSLMVLIAAVFAAVVVILAAWTVLRAIVRAPDLLSMFLRNRRGAKGYQAISRGMIAVGTGDAHAARRYASDARRLAPHEPLAMLLSAQAAQLSGDRAAAGRAFTELAERADTRLLGLRGLFVEAQRRDDVLAARTFAEEAAKLTPMPGWAGQAVLEMRCAEGDWAQALDALERNMRAGRVDRHTYRRQRAVLLTARAIGAADSEHQAAKQWISEAVSLAPTLIPAAAMAGRQLAESGDLRKGGRVIEKAWRAKPHPALAEAYLNLRFGDSARDRLARAQSLTKKMPGHIESLLMVAQAALDAQEFALARAQLAPQLSQPTQRVALLMADIERAEHGDVGRAREWMARAVHAARDPVWTADGYVSDRWLPVSPVSARIDAFEWKVPLEQLGDSKPPLDPDAPLFPEDVAVDRAALAAAPVAASDDPAATSVGEAAVITRPVPVAPVAVVVTADAAGTERPRPFAEDAAIGAGARSPLVLVLDAAAPAAQGEATITPPPRRKRPSKPGTGADVIPLLHAPDDPGPEPDTTPDPSPGVWRGH